MFSYSDIEKTLILIRKRFNDKVSSYVVNVLRNCDIYCCKMYSEKTKSIVLPEVIFCINSKNYL